MTLSKKPYRGTRDFFPQNKRVLDYLFKKMHQVSSSFSYEAYDAPLVEPVDLYLAKSGEELINDQIYSFEDRGKRNIAIRPEMTPSLARMIAQVHREEIKPLRWYSIPNLMRYEKPQRGRLREHWQYNCDIFGGAPIYSEIEVISLLINLLNSYGANQEHFEILINDRRIVDLFFSNILKLNSEDSYKLYKVVDKSKKVSPEVLEKMTNEYLNKDQFDLLKNYLQINDFDELKSFYQKYDIEVQDLEFFNFTKIAKELDLIKYLKYDSSIVRGLDYYTGIVFEAFDKHPENRRAICGGGSYSSLLKIFKEEPILGVGFGLGDVTLKDFLETHGLLPSVPKSNTDILLVTSDPTKITQLLSIADELRSSFNIMTQISPMKIGKAFKLCEKKEISNILILRNDGIMEAKNIKKSTHLDTENLNEVLDFFKG